MRIRKKLVWLFVLLLAGILLLSGCGANALEKTAATGTAPSGIPEVTPETTEEPGPMDEAQRIADYLFEYGELPDYFLTKKEAQALGWNNGYRYVSDAAPGMSIGGDYFGNYERKLPVVKGRKYYEADCFYQGGPRNKYRIVYSNDGHVWYTEDHYETFIELFPSGDDSINRIQN